MPCNSLYSPKHRRSHLLPRRCIGFCQYSMTYGAWVFKLTQTTKLLLLMTWWDIGFSTLVDLKKYSCWGDIFRNHTPSLMLISHQTRRGGVPPEAMLPWRIGKFSFDPMICMKPARRTETINRIHLFRSEKKQYDCHLCTTSLQQMMVDGGLSCPPRICRPNSCKSSQQEA